MVSKRSRLMALVLAVMTLISVVAVGTLSTSAAGGTVYCENAAGWSTVYCYMWGDSGKNAEWPGIQMTQGSDGLWAYIPTENWNNIIFNAGNGGAQTADLTLEGNCFNNSTNQWSVVQSDDTPVVGPTTPTTPTTPTPTPSGKNAVYCKNTAGWTTVNVYMWSDGIGENAAWPGVAATNIGDGVWMYEASKNYANVIFNNGSTKTGDLEFMGSDYIYDNSTNKWELYDTSKLHIQSFTADAESPSYTGVNIELSVTAGGGEGDLSYKFSVGSTVISDYSSSSNCKWTPATAGTYEVKVEVKDTAGQTVSKDMTFEIKDIDEEVKPVIQNIEVTPSNSENTEIKLGAEATVDVTAGGGNTGTKLLFYKYTITDPSGKTANVPYYTLKNQYKFTPASTGVYSITTVVQGSDNAITAKTVDYDCVKELSQPGTLTASLSHKDAGSGKYTFTATAAGGKAPYSYEFKLNGSTVQAASAKNTYTLTATDAGNYNVEVTVKDAEGTIVTKTDSVHIGGSDVEPTPSEVAVALKMEDKDNGIYKFTANATGGQAPYEYQFVANGEVVKEYSASNTVTLDMSADSQYTIKVIVRDSSGKTAEDQKVVKVSGGKLEMPLEATITISESGEFLVATANAIGGEGDYQYEFLVDGKVKQDYSNSNTFTFGFDKTISCVYSISVNVKDAKGTVASDDMDAWVENGEYGYGEWSGDQQVPTTKPSEPSGEYLKGDSDLSGKVNIKDATLIQKHVAKMTEMSLQGQENAEVDGNGKLNVKDATMIQKFLANMIEW